MQLLERSWQTTWLALKAQPATGLFERLVCSYGEPQRRYHTLQHLTECVQHLEPLRGLAQHPGEVEVALWFHDAVYEPKGADNELQSALWAQRELAAAGVPDEVQRRVHQLVMATQQATPQQSAHACARNSRLFELARQLGLRFLVHRDKEVPEFLRLKDVCTRCRIWSFRRFIIAVWDAK